MNGLTENNKSELNKLALEKHFDYMLKYANDIILFIDENLNIVEANDRALEYYQYKRGELIGMKITDIRAYETLSQFGNDLNSVNEKGFSTFETIHKRKDNTTFPIEISTRLLNIDGHKYYQSIGRDITDHKKTLSELDASVSLFRAAFESTADGLLVVSLDGKVVQYNQKFMEMWKIPQELLLKGDDSKVLAFVKNELKDPDAFIENVKSLYSNPDGMSFDLLEFNDGRFFERYSQPQIINGVSVGRVWSFRDITKRKKAEEELISAKEKAEESDRLKTAFLHNVSHEIRTPMNAMIGFASLLSEPDLSQEERKQYIDIIFQSGGQLLSIINDIVDIANVESGQAKVNIAEFNLNPAMRSLNEQFSIYAKEKDISVNLETSLSDEDAFIMTDSTKLIQILSNMMNNAMKFTQKGHVDFGYVLKDDFLEFFVRDTGIGIPEGYLKKIFDRFYQVDSAVSRKFSGTGLGLSICKGYVELLGGTIKVDSVSDTGTNFYFTIPYRHSKTQI